MYSDLPGESITETKIRMYQKQKIKTNSAFTSDEKRIAQHWKRSDLQCFVWKPCIKENMIIPKPEGCGWHMKDRKNFPVWYAGKTLPPSPIKRKTRKSVNSEYVNESDVANNDGADDDDDGCRPRKKDLSICFIT